jgi:hypothetical protein
VGRSVPIMDRPISFPLFQIPRYGYARPPASTPVGHPPNDSRAALPVAALFFAPATPVTVPLVGGSNFICAGLGLVAGGFLALQWAPEPPLRCAISPETVAPAAWDLTDLDNPRDMHIALQAALEVRDGDLMEALGLLRDTGWRFVYDPRRQLAIIPKNSVG